jgi:hypothetical protein
MLWPLKSALFWIPLRACFENLRNADAIFRHRSSKASVFSLPGELSCSQSTITNKQSKSLFQRLSRVLASVAVAVLVSAGRAATRAPNRMVAQSAVFILMFSLI